MDETTAKPDVRDNAADGDRAESALDIESDTPFAPIAGAARSGKSDTTTLDRAEELVLQFEAETAAVLGPAPFNPNNKRDFDARINVLLARAVRRMVWAGYSRQDAEDVAQDAAAEMYFELFTFDRKKYTFEQHFWFLWRVRALPRYGRERAHVAKMHDLATQKFEWLVRIDESDPVDTDIGRSETRDFLAGAPLTDDEKWGFQLLADEGLKPRDLVERSLSSDSANTWSQRMTSARRKLGKYWMEEVQKNDQ